MTLAGKIKKSTRDRRYYQRNRDAILMRKCSYYAANRGRIIATVAAYKRADQSFQRVASRDKTQE